MEPRVVTQVSVCLQLNPDLPLARDLRDRAVTWMDELASIEEADDMITDVEMSGDLDEHEITFEMVILTTDPLEANIKAMTAVRSALHAAGEATPGWPDAHMIAKALESAVVQTAKTSMVPA